MPPEYDDFDTEESEWFREMYAYIMRNPQIPTTTDTSKSWSSTSEPLSAPPAGMLTNEVICKHCSTRFTYPEGLGKSYMINGLDKAGLVNCRGCFDRLFPGSNLFPFKPLIKKGMYHNRRKLRIRRKE